MGCLFHTVSQRSKRSTEAQLQKTWHIGPIHAVVFFVTLPRYTVLSCVYPSDHTACVCVNSTLCFFGIHFKNVGLQIISKCVPHQIKFSVSMIGYNLCLYRFISFILNCRNLLMLDVMSHFTLLFKS